MKKIFKIVLLILVTIIICHSNHDIQAANYQVGNFPSSITTASPSYVWTYSYRPNGYTFMPYKSTNTGIPTFCTKFSLQEPYGGTRCSLDTNAWSESIKAGVAEIIKTANVASSGSSSNLPYYYAEIAINRFLYDYNGRNYFNRVYSGLTTYQLLTSNYINYYNAGVKAYNKVNKGIDVDLELVEGYDSRKLDTSTTSFTNTYKIDSTTSDTYTVSRDGQLPSGVNVQITDESGNVKTTFSGGSKFKVTVTGVQPSQKFNFKIKVTGKMNYNIAENYNCGSYQSLTPNIIQAKTSDTSDETTIKVIKEDEPHYPELIIKKRNNGNDDLAKGKFLITKDNVIYHALQSPTGDLSIKDLESGHYCVNEYKAPDGYIVNDKKLCFTVEVNGSNVNVTADDITGDNTGLTHISVEHSFDPIQVWITFIDQPTVLRITKVYKDENNESHPLAGVNLEIHDENGEIVKLNDEELKWTTSTEYKEITGLPAGNYFLVETSAPSGYAIDPEPKPFTISKKERGIITVEMENEKTVLNISKVDITNKQELKDAKLRILDENCQNVIKLDGNPLEWTSGTKPHTIEGLPAGSYCLEETSAPTGYKLLTEKIKFTMDKYGVVKVAGSATHNATVVMNNEPYKIYISKRSLTDSEELAGAHLQIIDSKGKVVEEWNSEEEPHLVEMKLPVGTYKLKETIAPAGYVLSEDEITFSVDKYGIVTVDKKIAKDSMVIMTNEYNKVYISKQDITTKQELPGAHLIVTDEEGNVVKDGDWISSMEPHLLEGLKPGTYTITEVTAPDGYTKNEEKVTFTVDKNGAVSGNTIMYNTPIPEVPSTLSTQSLIILVSGIVLIGAGVGLYIYGIKKKKEN